MRDLGGWIWILFVLFFVFSTIGRSMKRNAAGPSTQAPSGPQAPAPPPPITPKPFVRTTAAPAAVPASAPVPPQVQVPPPVQVQPPVRRNAGWFAKRGGVVNAVVAAEVLGRPKGETFGDPW